MSCPMATLSSVSWARWRSRQVAWPSRVTPAMRRTSMRSGWVAAAWASFSGWVGRFSAAEGGRTSRSMARATPCTSSGQAREDRSESRLVGSVRGPWPKAVSMPSCSMLDRAVGSVGVPSWVARAGSISMSRVVWTRANRRGGCSQPAAATCFSASMRQSRSGLLMIPLVGVLSVTSVIVACGGGVRRVEGVWLCAAWTARLGFGR